MIHPFEDEYSFEQSIDHLESIARQLKQMSDEVDLAPGIGTEVLWDNLNWLGGYIHDLKTAQASRKGAMKENSK